MKKTFLVLWLAIMLSFSVCYSQTVAIKSIHENPQGLFAGEKLRQSLLDQGYTIDKEGTDYIILLAIQERLEDESYAITTEGNTITITGGDNRGLIYGSFSLIEDLKNGLKLSAVKEKSESANYPFRAIKFDLPWDSYRHSYALDLHYETCRDVAFWEAFLDMMVENRFNSLSIWNLHPYPFMIKPTNFPEASPFSAEEMREWQNLHRSIFTMAAERAIDTYLIPFNIFVSPEFAKAHNVAMDNLDHHHFVRGDTSEIVKRYTREAVTQVLQEYPNLTGFGLTLGEGMGGMTPQEREDWMNETIIEGMRMAGRKSKLVHRIPFSSTTGSLGITSIETEKLTRAAIEKEGDMDFIEGPVWADLKYNWSHAHSTPQLVKVHGGKLYDTYFSPEPENYKITWTARNEDFFCLRWGVPDFIRKHIANNNHSYNGGYFIGSETYIPAKDYFTKIDGPVNWKYAFERQWLFYKLWGRLLYNPSTPDAVFQAEFVRRYGEKGDNLLEAYSLASTTPLRLASSYDFTWDFTLYSEGFLARDNELESVGYITVDRQINQAPLDPDYVSVKDYVKAIISGNSFEDNKVTPPKLAAMLEEDCKKALRLIEDIKPGSDNTLMYEVADIKTWSNLGLYFAEKLKGAVALQSYRRQGKEEDKQKAIKHLEKSLSFWDKVVSITSPIYKEMPLVHYSEQPGNTRAQNDQLRFHWKNLREEVAKDVEIAKTTVFKENK